MVPTSPFHFLRRLTARSRRGASVSHPDAVPDAELNLPRRIDDPASAAQLTRDLLRHHREDITPAIYPDDQHRLVGTAILATGWVQAGRLSAPPIVQGSQARRATIFVLVRFRRWGPPAPRNASNSPFLPSPQREAGTGSWR